MNQHWKFDGSELDGAGTYTIYHRTYEGNCNPNYFFINTTDDSRVHQQSSGYLMITEFKNN